MLLQRGNKRIENYVVKVDYDINVILKKEEWDNTLLIYKLENNNKEMDIYLIYDNEEIYLSSLDIIEIHKDTIKLSFWDRLINFLRNIFK